MNRQDIVLEVAADPRLLSSVRELVRAYLSAAGFPSDRVDELVLGVDEACTNAIRHGCVGQSEDTFRVVLRTVEDWIEIQLEDSGEPVPAEVFERAGAPPEHDADNLRPGGLGVHLIHEVFDEVEFCPGLTEGNCVTMKLKRPKQNRE